MKNLKRFLKIYKNLQKIKKFVGKFKNILTKIFRKINAFKENLRNLKKGFIKI